MYLEGPDQYRGWFHSSLLIGVGVRGGAPYRQVLTHGWTLDEHGRPMSKSLGNVVLPTEICEKWGADLLRLWVASQDYTADVRMSDNVMTQLSEAYRKIRNTFRFALGNLADFDPRATPWRTDRTRGDRSLDALSARRNWCRQCEDWYEAFDFHRVFHALHDFCGGGSQRVLLRRAEGPPVHVRRRANRGAAFGANRGLSHRQRAVAAGRAHAGVYLRGNLEVFSASAPAIPTAFTWRSSRQPEELACAVSTKPPTSAGRALLEVRDGSSKALWKQARNEKFIIRRSKPRSASIAGSPNGLRILRKYRRWLPALFIVSQVEIVQDSVGEGAGRGILWRG